MADPFLVRGIDGQSTVRGGNVLRGVAAAVTVIDWLPQLPDPVRRRPFAQQGGEAAPPIEPTLVVEPEVGWLRLIEQPLARGRRLSVVHGARAPPTTPLSTFDWNPQPNVPYLKHPPRQSAGASWSTLTPLPDLDWLPLPNVPYLRHPPRQTAGAVWVSETPLDDFSWTPLTNQPQFRHPPRQSAGERRPVSIPLIDLTDFDWRPSTNQPYLRHPPRQSAGQSGGLPFTNCAFQTGFDDGFCGETPDIDWISLTNQPYLRHPPRQTAGLSWHPETPAAPIVIDIDWLPRIQQPYLRHPPRQSAGAVVDAILDGVPLGDFDWWRQPDEPVRPLGPRQTAGASAPVLVPLPDLDWLPAVNEPYLRHPPRQTAGPSWSTFTPLDPLGFLPLVNTPYLTHPQRQTAGLVWSTFTPPPPIPIDIDWIPRTQQPYLRHPSRQAAGARAPTFVPLPEFVLFQEPQIIRRIPPRQTTGAVWSPETPLPDIDWLFTPPDRLRRATPPLQLPLRFPIQVVIPQVFIQPVEIVRRRAAQQAAPVPPPEVPLFVLDWLRPEPNPILPLRPRAYWTPFIWRDLTIFPAPLLSWLPIGVLDNPRLRLKRLSLFVPRFAPITIVTLPRAFEFFVCLPLWHETLISLTRLFPVPSGYIKPADDPPDPSGYIAPSDDPPDPSGYV